MSDQKKLLSEEFQSNHIIAHIDKIAYDMNCELFDGWYKFKIY